MHLPDLTKPSPLDLFRGFALPFQALGLLFATPKLKRLAWAVALVTIGALVGLLVVLGHLAPWIAHWIWSPPASWWASALHGLLTALIYLLLFIIGANAVPMTLAAPLMDPISEQAEEVLGFGAKAEGGVGRVLRETLRAIFNSLGRLVILVAGHAVLLLLLLIPGVGAVIWTVLSWLWTAAWVALQYLDVPMARHLYGHRDEIAVLRGRSALCLGFGSAVSLMLWVPLLNFFFVPVAVIAGTALYGGLRHAAALPPPPDQPGTGGTR